MIVAGVSSWLNRGDFFKAAGALMGYGADAGERWGNVYSAYGPLCVHLLLVFVAALILSVSLRKSPDPYRAIGSAAGRAAR